MKELASKISPAERKVLEVLWQAEEPLPIAAVREGLESSGWDGSTVKTLLRRLCEKQAVSAEKREVRHEDTLVTPLLTREEYRDWSTQELIERVYQGSALDLVAGLVRREQLTASDLEELRAIVAGEEGHG